MDIIITGKQGEGKTTQALALTEGLDQVTTITAPVTDRQKVVRQLHEARAKAVVFDDGAVHDLAMLSAAIWAVKEYRDQTGIAVTAVYCQQGEAINIIKKPV